MVAALVAALAIAARPACDADKARADEQAFGEAVGTLASASTPAEVDAALVDLHSAAANARANAGDALSEQIADQEDALDRAVDGFVGAVTTDDGFEADLYEARLETAVDDLERQAEDFRTRGPRSSRPSGTATRRAWPAADATPHPLRRRGRPSGRPRVGPGAGVPRNEG